MVSLLISVMIRYFCCDQRCGSKYYDGDDGDGDDNYCYSFA